MQINISFLQVDLNTLGIKFFYMIKHSQSFQSNKFAISLQYLRREVRGGVHFFHSDKYQSFSKAALSFLIEVAKHVQITQNRKR